MRYDQLSPVPPLTKVTKTLIIICAVVYIIDFVLIKTGFEVYGLTIADIFGLVPVLVIEKYWFWQPLTYIFLHGSPLHILLNMLILWYFGAELELRLGAGQFLKYFLLCGIGAGVFNLVVNVMFGDVSRLSHPIVGASGAIFGILAAYGIFYGNRYVLVLFLFPMKVKYFVLIIAAIEMIMGAEARPEDNVAHFAHIGGMAVGGLYIWFKYVRNSPSLKQTLRDRQKEKLRKQFTLIVNPDSKEEDKGKDKESGKGPHGPFWN